MPPLAEPPTKERLRQRARDLIADHGLRALSIRALCREVGIRESSFYAHFPSKEALLDSLLEDAGAEAPLRIVARLADAPLPVDAFVRQLVEQLVALWTDDNGRKLRVLLEAEASHTPALRDRFNERVLAMIDAVGGVLQHHVTSGALRAVAEPRVLAWSLIAPVAAMRVTLFAHGASADSVTEGVALAQAHAEAWWRAYGVSAR